MFQKSLKIIAACLGVFGSIVFIFWGTIACMPASKFSAPHLLFNKKTLPPFRAVVERFGSVVTWDAKKRTVIIEKDKNAFTVNIDSELKQGIPVYIDGNYIGKTPLTKKLSAGKYVIVSRPPGHVGSIRYLTLKPGDPTSKQIILPTDQNTYQQFLAKILALGYQPIRVADYYHRVPINKKTLVLRHDVDESAAVALQMAKAEQDSGIKSTYYFRWKTADPEIIKAIREMGHEVGLHYETLATYARKYRLTSAEQITPEIQTILRQNLKAEIAEFKARFGGMETLSSHGAEENIELQVTNYNAILKDQNPADYGVLGEAYGEITQHFSYMSDADGVWDPFPYPRLEKGEGPFYILIHPISWKLSFTQKNLKP